MALKSFVLAGWNGCKNYTSAKTALLGLQAIFPSRIQVTLREGTYVHTAGKSKSNAFPCFALSHDCFF